MNRPSMQQPQPELSNRRLPREDGSAGPPLLRPWRRWAILGRADIVAAILTAVATFFTGLVMFYPESSSGSLPSAYSVVAPLMGVVFFIALIAQFVERERHGIARALLISASVILAVSGVVFSGQVGAGRVLFSYWIPALIAVAAAIVLIRGHAAAGDPTHVRVRARR